MLLIALDLATVTGFAVGEAGEIPVSASARLKRPSEDRGRAYFNLRALLRQLTQKHGAPRYIIAEAAMGYGGQKSTDAARMAMGLVAVVEGFCDEFCIPYREVARTTCNKHFIGTARMNDRNLTKSAVIQRCVQLGYLPAGCRDDNRADACGLFDYASVTYARRAPSDLHLYGAKNG